MWVTIIIIIIIYVTISKPYRKNQTNIPGKYDIKELKKTAILGTAYMLQKVLK